MDKRNIAAEFKHQVLVQMIQAFLSADFLDAVNYIPSELRPKESERVRCCVYKERAVVAQRCLSTMGFSVENTDESLPLSRYGRQVLKRDEIKGPVLTVMDIACEGCVPSRFVVSEQCQGCLARPCTQCPFGAIEFRDGKSYIIKSKCKNCGLCAKNCPYGAILELITPCEEACPVKAIAKNERNVAQIDHEKCISCGRCANACPFGSIGGKSQILDVLGAIRSGKKVVAMLAPAVMGQFGDVPVGKILRATRKAGFSDAIEVAHGADETTRLEAAELAERLEHGAPFMTTSCCPAYMTLVEKHMPEMKEFVSHTHTPMHYTAKQLKTEVPETVTVFVGPCSAKREEGLRDEYTDYVLTVQELGALFDAKGIVIAECLELIKDEPSKQGRGFPLTKGVAGAVASLGKCPVKALAINGLNKESIRQLRQFAKNKSADGHNLIEVMSCEGGCVGGPCVLANSKKSVKEIQKLLAESTDLK